MILAVLSPNSKTITKIIVFKNPESLTDPGRNFFQIILLFHIRI